MRQEYCRIVGLGETMRRTLHKTAYLFSQSDAGRMASRILSCSTRKVITIPMMVRPVTRETGVYVSECSQTVGKRCCVLMPLLLLSCFLRSILHNLDFLTRALPSDGVGLGVRITTLRYPM